ncbi:MAG: asparagine synthase (glutamine-hydrolyzing) [Candidatus Omnitrophica bacterium]|nr:asparagine synthase (glutamine-hydrolyzing) [Candidatus Omnitrophota bacterium]
MCGIAGVVHFDGRPVASDVLQGMVAALRHRGPEGEGIQSLATGSLRIGLGHARLKIIDLSDAAAQPMGNDDGSIWLVFNGEIYNFRELRASLEQRGHRFRTSSDTEVLLKLYEADGDACVQQLEGMFAFAMWDSRKGQLLLARDRAGKKPLFYRATPTMIAFASEMKALFQHPDIVPEVDTATLPAFFLFGYVPSPATIYQGIQQLPPGQVLIARDGHVRLQEYWDAPLPPASSGRAPSEAEAASRVRELLTAAVARRLISDVPLGAFLSGGIDSSIVVGIMSRLCDEPVRTFSIGFAGDPAFDETSYARIVAKRFGTRHTEFIVEPKAIELIDRLVWHHDGPFADSSAIPTYLLAQLTKQHVTVALSGDGGDELFAGYQRFRAVLLSEAIPRWLRTAGASALTRLPAWGHPRSLYRRAQRFAQGTVLPFEHRVNRWVSIFYEDLPQLRLGASGGATHPSIACASYLARSRQASALTQLLYVNFKMYLLDDLLVKMDRCSMAHALEARSPFLDRALIEYVCGLPDAMKLRGGATKVILRKAFADLLPPEVLTRGKMGFGVPLHHWFRYELRDFVTDWLLAPNALLRQYLHQPYVRQLVQQHFAGRCDHSHRLWTLLTFEVWLQQLRRGAFRAAAPSLNLVTQ